MTTQKDEEEAPPLLQSINLDILGPAFLSVAKHHQLFTAVADVGLVLASFDATVDF